MTDNLTLRVAKKHLNKLVGVNDLPKTGWLDIGTEPKSNNDTTFLIVIQGPLVDIQGYGTTVAWLFDLARSIFGKEISKQLQPYGELWAGNLQPTMTTPLIAAIYEYRPQHLGPSRSWENACSASPDSGPGSNRCCR